MLEVLLVTHELTVLNGLLLGSCRNMLACLKVCLASVMSVGEFLIALRNLLTPNMHTLKVGTPQFSHVFHVPSNLHKTFVDGWYCS